MKKEDVLEYLVKNKDERGISHWEKTGIKNLRSFGIGVTKLKAFAKKAGKNHQLALELWEEPVFECKTLATLIDNPKIITRKQIDYQIKDANFWMLSNAYCGYLLPKYPEIKNLAEEWMNSKNDLERRCGFHLIYNVAKKDKKLPDEYFIPIVNRIEKELQNEENFVKDAMNNALWAIGMRSHELNKKCIAVAQKIGKVEVDYGDNSCQAIDVKKHLSSERLQKRLNT